jgi:hypothetical protein
VRHQAVKAATVGPSRSAATTVDFHFVGTRFEEPFEDDVCSL